MRPRAFVFDAYGTLFDVHAAIGKYRAEAGPDADRLSELWRAKQLEYSWALTLAGRYADFWTLTEAALDHALARVTSVDRKLKSKLLQAYLSLAPYPDARGVIAELKVRGLKTAILSNGSPSMLAAAVAGAKFENDLDAVLSVDKIRMYKPRPEVYALATEALAIPAGEVVFVSSNGWDVMGAAAFGFRTVWVNRSGAPAEYSDLAASVVLPHLLKVPALAD